jgi:D-specific alpha-keto acid dehydrogenase
MSYREPGGVSPGEHARAAARRPSLAASSASTVPPKGITIYGCEPDEAVLFQELAPRFGVTPTITAAAASEANICLALGNRCISVGPKTRITDSTLSALSRAGIAYISTRSIGYNHIDVDYAESVGISVENVVYSPDSVADFTLMLMLMVVRDAKSIIRRADVHDYRLNDVRGKELRDLTVGIMGTGRIGTAVMDRLRGFGCRILAYDKAYDSRPKPSHEYVPLDELLRRSDMVTLHAPLTADTHHLLNRRRIEAMRPGPSSSTRGAARSSIPRPLCRRWKAVAWAVRRWTSSKERKEYSTPTAETSPLRAKRCCGCKNWRTW